jgi:hypothetical protein
MVAASALLDHALTQTVTSAAFPPRVGRQSLFASAQGVLNGSSGWNEGDFSVDQFLHTAWRIPDELTNLTFPISPPSVNWEP